MAEPKIYPYSRISSKKQEKGKGLSMQEENAALQALSKRYNLPIYERMVDNGKSAFHGHHIEGGQLGGFIKAVESGEIAPGSILVVSNLDRFSRQEPKASTLNLAVVFHAGVALHSIMDDRTYCDPYDKSRDHGFDIAEALAELRRAYKESETKQKRTNARADLDIERHQRGERHPSGYAYSIEVVGNNSWWVDTSDGSVKPHEIYHGTARLIALRLIDGESPESIAKSLNDTGPKAPTKRLDKRAPGAWSAYMIRELHKQRTLIGEKRIKGQLLLNYYPPVLSNDEYHRLVHVRTKRQQPRTNSKATAVNLFARVKNAVCGHCGAGINMAKVPGGYRYYCSQRRYELHCPGWRKDRNLIEKSLLDVCLHKLWEEPEQKVVSRVPIIMAQIAEVERKIAVLAEQAEKVGFPEILTKRLKELENDQEAFKVELGQAQVEDAASRMQSTASLQARWREVTDEVMDINNHDARRYMRALIIDSVSELVIMRPSLANLSRRLHMMKHGQSLKEKIPSGSEQFILSMRIKFVDGAIHRIRLTRDGIERVSASELEEQSPEARERLASIETVSGFFNECQPRTEESDMRLREVLAAMEALDPLPSDEYPTDEYHVDEHSAYWGDE